MPGHVSFYHCLTIGIREMGTSTSSRDEILRRLSEIAADHFDQSELQLTEAMTAADVSGWDSISHIQLMMEIEEKLGFRFKSAEINSARDVGELVTSIARHVAL